MKNIFSFFTNKRGDEMVEASISLPIIILTVILLLRVFTFYLSILTTGISEHEQALNLWDKYEGKTIKNYEREKKIKMFGGGLLGIDLTKIITTKAYFYNEDVMVRANEIIE